ncbi:hypothetical protein DL89DRAFT_306474 [Linderina pennispora]|uniref:Phosphoglycerate mutase-like protein n=1 Tax=Linderina pennispora TaxID=61395 RepID=A0A1Y1VY92_9FUNG|nr:uncharacterized protein DL89DRAFT_306474 [Linderina pennispora]ORX66250.1 hypothetical protein DL89DRAFT_306474 [Linderina pennispora]
MKISILSAISVSAAAASAASLLQAANPKFYCEAPRPQASTYTALPGHTLAHLQVVHRHGDRVPDYYSPASPAMDICGKYPDLTRQCNVPGVPIGRTEIEIDSTLPYANVFWSGNCELGQLTDLASEKMVRLGKTLRSIYIDKLGFMSQGLWANDIYFRADYI